MTELFYMSSPYVPSGWVLDSAEREEEGWSVWPAGQTDSASSHRGTVWSVPQEGLGWVPCEEEGFVHLGMGAVGHGRPHSGAAAYVES